MQIINHQEFTKAALDLNKKAFIVHLATFTLKIALYLSCRA